MIETPEKLSPLAALESILFVSQRSLYISIGASARDKASRRSDVAKRIGAKLRGARVADCNGMATPFNLRLPRQPPPISNAFWGLNLSLG